MKPITLLGVYVSVMAGLSSSPALAQSAISARSGMIHYVEGRVFVGDQAIESKFGNFPELKENAQLRTEEGRAEVLLTPGVFLRVGENSSIRMITNRLIDTRLEFLSGTVIVEADDLLKDNAVTIVYKDTAVHLRKRGLYRFDSQPAELRVFDGEAEVESGGKNLVVKEGKLLPFNGEMALEKFDNKSGDALNRWSRRRAEYLSMANISAAKSVRDSGLDWQSGGWRFNPYFGMFTFIPMRSYYSPYGYRFWSPVEVYRVYEPRVYLSTFNEMPRYNSSLGYNTMPQTSSGYSGAIAASAPAQTTTAAGAASAPISRESGHAGGRSR